MKFKKLADLLDKKQRILVTVRYFLIGEKTPYSVEQHVLSVDKALDDYAIYEISSIGRDFMGFIKIDLWIESQYKIF